MAAVLCRVFCVALALGGCGVLPSAPRSQAWDGHRAQCLPTIYGSPSTRDPVGTSLE